MLAIARSRPETCHAWRGSAILIVEPEGSAGGHRLTGFYFRQTRFLRDLRLEIEGAAPYPCGYAEASPDVLELAYVFPPVTKGDGGGSGSGGVAEGGALPARNIDLRLTYRVHPASLEASLRITSRWVDDIEIELAWLLSADFAGIDEAHFGTREQEAGVESVPTASGLRFRYLHPRLPLETLVSLDGVDSLDAMANRLVARVHLTRQESREIRLVVRARDFEEGIDEVEEGRREARLAAWHQGVTRIVAPAETPLADFTTRAMGDLAAAALLDGPANEWLTPGAGVPLYQTLWGRDALTTAWQAGIFDRGEMLGDVLARMTRLQGVREDPDRDEEPGRIINQAKMDPLSRLGDGPFGRSYADFASPFMFIIGLGYHYVLTGERAVVERHWAAAKRVLEWAKRYGDRDGDGYLEYLTKSQRGPTHQGWKDSENAIVDHEGEKVSPPIAPCEIQGYHYVSLQYMAVLSGLMGERSAALDLWRQAADLKERFNRDFWMEDEGFLAFGLDAEKRQIRAVTSSAGHALPTGIVSDQHVPRLVRRIFEPDLFNGWGIRTLSTSNPAYNPLDYHLGSVWPVENATILFGLRRYGLNDRSLELAQAIYDLGRLWPGGRTPECVGGYGRDEYAHPGIYPRANAPQTWNQSAYPLLVQALLGLVPVAPLNLLLVDPILPSWFPELTLRGLRVGEATLDMRFSRGADERTEFEILRQEGKLRVIRQPWLQSFTAGTWERLRDLAESALPFRSSV